MTKDDAERVEILRSVRGKSVAELNAEVDHLLTRIVTKTAAPGERRRAAVLATVVLDRS
jgi:hypothetical protein